MPSTDTGYPVNAQIQNSAAATLTATCPASAGKLVMAVVSAANRTTGGISVSGFGLTWTKIAQADNAGWLSCSVFAAWAASGNPGGTLTVNLPASSGSDVMVEVYALSGTADGSASIASAFGQKVTDITDGSSQVTLATTSAGSGVYGGISWSWHVALTAAPNTTVDGTSLDTTTSVFQGAFTYTGATGGSVTTGFNLTSGVNTKAEVAVEVLGATPAPPPGGGGGGGGPPPPAGSNPDVGTSYCTEKILPSYPARSAKDMTLYGAGNEFVSFYICVKGPHTVNSITINGFGPVGSANIHVYRVDAVPLNQNTGADGFGGSFGPVSDPLMPDVDEIVGEKRNAFPTTVGSTTLQPYWIDILIPNGAATGTYTGSATVVLDGTTNVAVPITLNVWGFSLPATSSIANYFGFSYAALTGRFGGSPVGFNRLRQMAGQLGLDHRATLLNWDSGDNGQANFDTFCGPLLKGTSSAQLPGAQMTKISINGSFGGGALVNYINGINQSGKIIGYDTPTQDEPGRGGLNNPGPTGATGQTCIDKHNADQAISGSIKDLVTTDLNDASTYGFDGSMDILCPLPHDYWDKPPGGNVRSSYNSWLAASGKRELWYYISCDSAGCGGSFSYATGWPSFAIDCKDSTGAVTLLRARMTGWMTYIFNVTGFLYYETTVSWWGGKNPWVNESNCLVFAGGNGDGTMLYPGNTGVIGGSTDIMCSSLRLKAYRDGAQDYEYLKLLDRFNDSTGRNLANAMFPNPWTQPTTDTFNKNRITIGNQIHLLTTGTAFSAGAAAVPAGITATGTSGGVILTWGAVAAATGYNIYRSNLQAGPFTKLNATPVTGASYTDATAGAGATLWYTVTSLNATGESAQSAPVSATMPIVVATGVPVSGSASTGSIVAPSFPQTFNVVAKPTRILHPNDQVVNLAQNQIIGSVNAVIDAVNNMPTVTNGSFAPGQWQVPPLLSGWAGTPSLAYSKDAAGNVHLRGQLAGGTLGQPAFTLPQGFRPGADMTFPVLSANTMGSLVVGRDGSVTPATGSTNQIVLDGVPAWLAEG